MKSSSKLISATIITLIFCFCAALDHKLKVKNNSPATIGANITFTALLEDYSPRSSLIFKFDDGVRKKTYTRDDIYIEVNETFTSDLYTDGLYCMNITVAAKGLIREKIVAFNRSCFILKRELIGKISVCKGNFTSGCDVDEVAVGENITLALDIYDPNGFLQNASFDNGWNINMERHRTLDNILTYNFNEPGLKRIKAVLTATLQDGSTKYGYFQKAVDARNPIKRLNVSGNFFHQHGDLLHLNVSCDGSPPFEYCHDILKPNASENFTCSHLSFFTTCHMQIQKFLRDGEYKIGIYVSNDVTEQKRVFDIKVYNVTIKPTLSTIIIPIVCSLLTLIIIAMGISYCIQQRNQLAVEVANFDFQEDSDSYIERTFFEQIFDSFTCRNCRAPRFSCNGNRSESDPLLYEESLPEV